jgi:hypothetical protein
LVDGGLPSEVCGLVKVKPIGGFVLDFDLFRPDTPLEVFGRSSVSVSLIGGMASSIKQKSSHLGVCVVSVLLGCSSGETRDFGSRHRVGIVFRPARSSGRYVQKKCQM